MESNEQNKQNKLMNKIETEAWLHGIDGCRGVRDWMKESEWISQTYTHNPPEGRGWGLGRDGQKGRKWGHLY